MDQVNENAMLAEPPKPTVKQIGREAAAMAHKSEIWHHLTVALLVAMLFTYAVALLFTTVEAFCSFFVSDMTAWLVITCLLAVLTVIGWMLVSAPVWFARLRMAALLSEGRAVSYRDVFYYFSDKRRLLRTWRVSIIACLLAVLAALAVTVLFGGAVLLYMNVFLVDNLPVFALAMLLLCLLAALVITFLMLFFAGVFLPFVAVALGNEEMSVRQAFAASLRAARRQKRYIFSFTMRQIPHVLLSLVTIGVYYIFWYAPRFVLSYLRLSRALCPKEEHS